MTVFQLSETYDSDPSSFTAERLRRISSRLHSRFQHRYAAYTVNKMIEAITELVENVLMNRWSGITVDSVDSEDLRRGFENAVKEGLITRQARSIPGRGTSLPAYYFTPAQVDYLRRI